MCLRKLSYTAVICSDKECWLGGAKEEQSARISPVLAWVCNISFEMSSTSILFTEHTLPLAQAPLHPQLPSFSFLLLSSFLPRLYMSYNGEKPNNNLDSKLKDSLHSVVRRHFYYFTSPILPFRQLQISQTLRIKSSRYKIICNRNCAQHTAKFNLLKICTRSPVISIARKANSNYLLLVFTEDLRKSVFETLLINRIVTSVLCAELGGPISITY